MSRTIVQASTMSRTGTSLATKTYRVRYITAVQPSFCRYASGDQTVVTKVPPTG